MPPFLRRRRFWGLDWFTPREIPHHLSWRERERMIAAAWEAVRHHPRYWLMAGFPQLLNLLVMSLVLLCMFLKMSALLVLPLMLFTLIQSAARIIWQRKQFRAALRKKLFDFGIRPGVCFECGYDVDGYEGKECPACDTPLLRQADSPSEIS